MKTEQIEEICFWIGMPIIIITCILAMKGYIWTFYLGGFIIIGFMIWILISAFKEVTAHNSRF